MDTATFSLFFSVLALVALAFAVASAVAWAVGRKSTVLHHAAGEIGRYAGPLAFAVALTSTLGSLYYSEVANFVPCQLCWFQRIAMYPLALVLGIAALRRDGSIRPYGVALAVAGAAVAAYHYQLQLFPDQSSGGFCDPSNPCHFQWVEEFGFVSIPFMAFCGFAAVVALLLMPAQWARSEEDE